MIAAGSPTVLLSVTRLKKTFVEAIESRRLGGAGILDELSGHARACIPHQERERKIVAHVLASFLTALAHNRNERPVSVDEDRPLYEKAHPQISRAIAFLEKSDETIDPVALAANLIDLESEIPSWSAHT